MTTAKAVPVKAPSIASIEGALLFEGGSDLLSSQCNRLSMMLAA
jgi:hypothetical protein